MINIPNLLSFARLLSVPATIWLVLDGRLALAFWLFVAAGVTDAVDGYIAKRFDARTELGAFLDPLADKALLVGTYLTLGWLGHIPAWLVILVVFRDLMIVGGAFVVYAMTQSFKSEPIKISKINTAVQIAVVTLVLARLGLGFDDGGASQVLAVLAGITTVLSGGAYLVRWTRRLSRIEGAP